MRTGLVVLVAWIAVSVPFGIMVGRWLARSGKDYPEVSGRCGCELSRNAERILQDGRSCPYPVDGEDGLCAMCRFTCLPLLKELREGIRRG
jgi:hypothetical protein